MICVFIQLRCRPGRTYEVADAIYDLEFASELYSTSGEYDLMMKVYIPEGDRHRPFHQREAARHPASRPQPDDADLQGVLMRIGSRLGRRLCQRAAYPGRRRLSAALGGGGGGVPRGHGRAAARGHRLRGASAAAVRPLPAGGDAGGARGLRARRLLARLRPRRLVASRRRAAGARLGGGDAGLRAGARGADRGDHGDDPRGDRGGGGRGGGADPAGRAFGGRASRGAAALRRQPAARGGAGADRAGGADQRARRPAPAAAARSSTRRCGSTCPRRGRRARRWSRCGRRRRCTSGSGPTSGRSSCGRASSSPTSGPGSGSTCG